MKLALCCCLLFTAGLHAQSTAKLGSDLMTLANPGVSRSAAAQQIADDITALAERDAQPARRTAFDFADELTKAIAGKQLGTENIKPVIAGILDVLQSSGMTSYRFHAAIDSFRNALIMLNATAAEAKSASDRLFILGQEVRGPEDLPTTVNSK